MNNAERARNRARKQQTKDELTAFQRDVARWLSRRRDDDRHRQHWSQLNAVESCLLGAADYLARQLDERAREEAPEGELYATCRTFDLRICWLQRLWHYFRQRLDQRDDPALRPVLDAADDVVWSCYRPAIMMAGDAAPGQRRGAPPLPFIDHEFSPAATPADWVPEALKREGGFLRNYLLALPFPVIHLPAATLRSPWMLVLVGHEVGHHVQIELGLEAVFQGRIERAVDEAGGNGAAWAGWSREIFADAYSVFTMGAEAVRAMAELVRAAPRDMVRTLPTYPAPAVRLALLTAIAERHGLLDTGALDGWRLEDCVRKYPELQADLALVGAVAAACGEPLPLPGGQGALSLAELCSFDAAAYPADGQLAHVAPGVLSARVATSAAMTRWALGVQEATGGAGGEPPLEAMRQKLLRQIQDGREPGLRSPGGAPSAGRDERLGELLMSATQEELGRV